MLGRGAEREEVLARLLDPGSRLVSITGRGGIGKSCLADQVARALRAQPGLEVVEVPLAGVTAVDLVVPEIATALRIAPLPGTDLTDALVHRLSGHDVVLVLDSLEHVVDAAVPVAALLERCPGLRVLVTSQVPLRRRDEHVVALDPLSLDDSIQLYCDRALAVDRHFTRSDTNEAAIARLCARLEGLPLAVELAAARAATLPAAEVLALLDAGPLDVLRRDRPDTPPRHHDLRAAIAWTYGLLGPPAQRLLRRISVVSGPFDIDTADALSDSEGTTDVLDHLSTLVDFHLVDPVPDAVPARYSIPDSVRAYATEQLRTAGDEDDARRRRVAWRAEFARTHADEAALERLAMAHRDMLEAIDDALALDLVDDALDIVSGLGPVWEARGYYDAHDRMIERVLTAAGERETVSYTGALAWSAWLRLRMRRPQREPFLSQLRRAEELARAGGDEALLLRVLSFWMRAAAYTGDFARAAEAAAEGVAVAETTRGGPWPARYHAWTGMIAHQLGDDDRAVELGMTALAEARRANDRYATMLAVMLLSPLAPRYPDIAARVPPTTEALAIARQLGLSVYEPTLASLLVLESAQRGDDAAATQWCEEALTLTSAHPGTPLSAYSLIAAAMVGAMFGDDDVVCYFDGIVRDALPTLASSMPPEAIAAYQDVLRGARERLGPEAADAEVRRGTRAGWVAASDDALDYVRKHLPPPAALDTAGKDVPESLTPRQLEVVELLAAGLSNKEIAGRLGVTPKTVMHHTTGVYKALGVRSRSEAVAWAFRAGIVV